MFLWTIRLYFTKNQSFEVVDCDYRAIIYHTFLYSLIVGIILALVLNVMLEFLFEQIFSLWIGKFDL